MFSYNNPREKDLFQKYKQQTYRLAFPLGIVINILYMIVMAKGYDFLFYLSAFQTVLLLVLTIMVWGRSTDLGVVEPAFYFLVQITFLFMTHASLARAMARNSLSPAVIADLVNSLALWTSIFMLAGSLTLKPKVSILFIAFAFFGVALLGMINLVFLQSAGHLTSDYLFRWVNPLAGLLITILLLQRMGLLQQRQARTDALTGLLNRHSLYSILDQELARAFRYKRELSVIIFDLDNFKTVNDTLGHAEGDKVLVNVSFLVRGLIRSVDYIGRWGGEEFLIVLPEANLMMARRLADRLRSEIERGGLITASFGVAFNCEGNLENVLRAADRALYQAKQNGRNQIVVFPPPETID